MNEPHGYTDAQWADLAAKWLATYRSVPRNRVFVSGAGYNDHVTSVCADPRLKGTYLSLHHYGFWKDYATYDQWVSDLKERLGDLREPHRRRRVRRPDDHRLRLRQAGRQPTTRSTSSRPTPTPSASSEWAPSTGPDCAPTTPTRSRS